MVTRLAKSSKGHTVVVVVDLINVGFTEVVPTCENNVVVVVDLINVGFTEVVPTKGHTHTNLLT